MIAFCDDWVDNLCWRWFTGENTARRMRAKMYLEAFDLWQGHPGADDSRRERAGKIHVITVTWASVRAIWCNQKIGWDRSKEPDLTSADSDREATRRKWLTDDIWYLVLTAETSHVTKRDVPETTNDDTAIFRSARNLGLARRYQIYKTNEFVCPFTLARVTLINHSRVLLSPLSLSRDQTSRSVGF